MKIEVTQRQHELLRTATDHALKRAHDNYDAAVRFGKETAEREFYSRTVVEYDGLKASLDEAAQPCQWTQDSDGNWDTGCGEAYSIIEGTPAENELRFCCYCGHDLVEVVPVADDDPSIWCEACGNDRAHCTCPPLAETD